MRNLYSQLKSQLWIEPWLDEVKLLPGMDWEIEIFKAIRDADVIIVCLSTESIAKEGFVQKEFKRALAFAEEKPDGTIYIIPLRLDDCQPPVKFQQWQWLNYFLPEAQNRLLQSLYLRAGSLKILPPVRVVPMPSSANLSEAIPVAPVSTTKTPNGQTIFILGGLEFVKIPAGDFYMGADDIDNSRPQHLVYQLNYDFYMARFAVTNLQYSLMARETGLPIIMAKGKAAHPVVNISWYDAQKYIEWLNKKYKANLPIGYHFCLPSEAEWEKSARGEEGNEYPWGDTYDSSKCNIQEVLFNIVHATTPVGAYSPQGDSPYGCADMAGNVWEWTCSLWGKDVTEASFKYPYSFDNKREDENADQSIFRVLRGGSFNSIGWLARCAIRTSSPPGSLSEDFGFRVVVSPFLSP